VDSLERNLPKICKSFIKDAKPDSFNESYMDSVIDRVCSEANADLGGQRSKHSEQLYFISNIHRADHTRYMNALVEKKQKLEQEKRELMIYEELLVKGTALEGKCIVKEGDESYE